MSNPNLAVTISAETAQLTHALTDLAKRLDTLKGQTKDVSKEMGSSMGGALDGMAGKLAGLYAAMKVKESFESTLKLSDSVKVISGQLGIGANQAGLYALALNRIGSDASGLLSVTGKLSAKIEKGADIFAQSGIDVTRNGKMRTQVDILRDITLKYDEIEGSSAKAQFGNRMLGKSFNEALPILREFFEHLEYTEKVMSKFNVKIDFGKIRDMAEENEAKWKDFDTVLNVLKLRITSEVLPSLTRLAATLTNSVGAKLETVMVIVKGFVATMSNGMAITTGAVLLLAAAIRSLTLSMIANPAVALTIGVIALAAGLDWLATSENRANQAQQEYTESLRGKNKALADAQKTLSEYSIEVDKADKQLKGSDGGTKQHIKAQGDLDKATSKLLALYPELNGYLVIENGHVKNLTESLARLNDEKKKQFQENDKLIKQNLATTEKASNSKYTSAVNYDRQESTQYGVGRAYGDDGSLTAKGSGVMADLGQGLSPSAISQARNVSTILVGLMKDNAIAYKAYLDAKGASNGNDLAGPKASLSGDSDGGTDTKVGEKFGVSLALALNKALADAAKAAEAAGMASFDATQVKEDFLKSVQAGKAPGLHPVTGADRQEIQSKMAEVQKEQADRLLRLQELKLASKIKESTTLSGQISQTEILISKEGDPVKRHDAQGKLNELKAKQLDVERDILTIQGKSNTEDSLSQLDTNMAEIRAWGAAGLITAKEELALTHKIFLERLRIKELEIDAQIAVEKDPKKKAELTSQKAGIGRERARGTADHTIEVDKQKLRDGTFSIKSFFTSVKNELKDSRDLWADWHGFVGSILGSLHSEMSKNLAGMLSGGQTFGEGMKAVWSSVSDSALAALSEIIMKTLEAQLIELLWPSIKGAVAAETVAADGIVIASTTAKTAVEGVETGVSITGAIAKIFSAHAGIPFVGPLIAIGLIALMMSAFKSNSAGATARAKGGVAGLNGSEYTVLGDGGEPEWVLPKSSFEKEFHGYTNKLLGEHKGSPGSTWKPVSSRAVNQASSNITIMVPNGFVGDRVAFAKYLKSTLNGKALNGY